MESVRRMAEEQSDEVQNINAVISIINTHLVSSGWFFPIRIGEKKDIANAKTVNVVVATPKIVFADLVDKEEDADKFAYSWDMPEEKFFKMSQTDAMVFGAKIAREIINTHMHPEGRKVLHEHKGPLIDGKT